MEVLPEEDEEGNNAMFALFLESFYYTPLEDCVLLVIAHTKKAELPS